MIYIEDFHGLSNWCLVSISGLLFFNCFPNSKHKCLKVISYLVECALGASSARFTQALEIFFFIFFCFCLVSALVYHNSLYRNRSLGNFEFSCIASDLALTSSLSNKPWTQGMVAIAERHMCLSGIRWLLISSQSLFRRKALWIIAVFAVSPVYLTTVF